MIKKLLLSLTLIVICNLTLNSQSNNAKEIPIRKNFSFGEYWYLNLNYQERGGNLGVADIKFNKEGIVYGDSMFFMGSTTLDLGPLEKLIKATDVKSIVLLEDTINFFWLDGYDIKSFVFFWRCQFKNILIVKKTKFKDSIYFDGSILTNCHFDSVTFEGYTSFGDVEFINDVNMTHIKFQYSTFEASDFLKSANFSDCIFVNSCFENVTFNKFISFTNTKFFDNANFERSKFLDICEFTKTSFYDTLNLYKTSFSDGLDLRRTSLDSIEVILLEDTKYPLGKLYFYWEQFKGRDKPKIRLKTYTADKVDDYKRIERIYLNLRDNFQMLGDKYSADEVMYELAWQKDIIVGNIWDTIYGIILGYGYQPWRYIFVVLPLIILFAYVWYKFYFGIIVFIVNPNFESDLLPTKISSVKLPIKYRYIFNKKISYYDHNGIEPKINFLTRIWYVIFFSTSVLLGIRFKKEWIKAIPKNKLGNKTFMVIVSVEWITGILLYIIFISLVLSSQFNNVKGILGF